MTNSKQTHKGSNNRCFCLSEGLKPEKNEAIGYHDDGREEGGGGGGGLGFRTVSFGECHLHALMVIRAAAGVNNIRALKYWENWALQRIRLHSLTAFFSPYPSLTNLLLLFTYPQQHLPVCLYLFTHTRSHHTDTHPSHQPRLPAIPSLQVSCWPLDEWQGSW